MPVSEIRLFEINAYEMPVYFGCSTFSCLCLCTVYLHQYRWIACGYAAFYLPTLLMAYD
jgi:hypothetical protein